MQTHILITGIFYPGGGLGGVLTNLLRHFKGKVKVSCIVFVPSSVLSETNTQFDADETFIVPLGRDVFRINNEVVEEKIKSNCYTHVLTLGPMSMNSLMVQHIRELNSEVKLISFIPHEGSVINTYDFGKLDLYDFGVFYSKHVFDQYQHLNESNKIINNYEKRFGYAYHGIEFDHFFPLSDDPIEKVKKARKQIEAHQHLPDEAIVILNSNQAFYRKGLSSTLDAFQHVSKHSSNAYLHLHFGNLSDGTLSRLKKEIDSLGNNRIIYTYSLIGETVHSIEWMNCLYNACDIGLTTSYGEGWGLGIYEHSATGAAIVGPDHTVFTENWKDIALLAEINETKFLFYENSEIYLPSCESVAAQLLKLINNRKFYHECARKCYQNVHSGKYDWAKTANYFMNIINQSSSINFKNQQYV
jgi:D-inositol-3-phosphate glycosyltransferase